ncbi:hypothetical protein [Terriglobus saanensis]|uniref:AMIN domain-containing protein n=1 Tax=Terriglobus saanensis (strain ATCC BAA-1853 / DSM 23119 / SP1PR4) TaxID=401053 RepID=E8V8M4_TERSS|nr:hypothetical protein [Terriglobus saanensis]ADV84061.1 hypothetical protein AciPR4_3307 [Terriglobus saanensis SP1PR4]
MKRVAFLVLAIASLTQAQMHRVARPDSITRAVGVYEWTGDLAKPTAARLIPITLFLSGHFEDAAIYLSTPVPLAIQTGTAYELQTAGVRKSFLDISYARNLRSAGVEGAPTAYDDGWFGYGKYRPLPKPKPSTQSAKNGRPEFASRVSLDDDVKDKKDRKSDDPDPERPTLQRPNSNTTAGKQKAPKETSGVSQAPPDPDSDPDRPSLKRHASAPDASESTEGVTAVKGSVLGDPDRPGIHRGRPTGATAGELLPQLSGLPPDLHQMIAVSDAVDRPEHDFTHHFSADADRVDIISKMQAMAKAVLANPALAAQTANPTATPDAKALPEPAPAPAPAVPKTTATRTRPGVRKPHNQTTAPAAVSPDLLDGQLSAFDLSYNSTPTYVFTAHTAGAGAAAIYVTIVAQPDLNGGLQPVMRSYTDGAHLDRVPRLRFVDVVDAEASNRASLLFELRASRSRQFALYRILAGRADQTFLTGSTQ